MDFFDLVNRRRSIRRYGSRPVEAADLTRILDAANRAPSAGNLQAYAILVVRKLETKRALVRAALDQDFLAQAPVVLAFFALPSLSSAKYRERGVDLYAMQDATIACAYAQLAATALGLGTVWVGAFDDASVKRILQVEADWRPAALLPIGYSDEAPGPTARRRLEELARELDEA
jgi:nitroreductase